MTMKEKLVLRIHRESPVKAIQQRVTRQHEQCMEGASVRWRTIVLGSSRSGVPAVARRRQPSGATPVYLPDFGRRSDPAMAPIEGEAHAREAKNSRDIPATWTRCVAPALTWRPILLRASVLRPESARQSPIPQLSIADASGPCK